MMVPFVSLPNELICDILKLVEPEDLENFAQTSRNVFSLASPFLTKHRALIREYHTLRNDTDSESISSLLRTVITYPRIGSYVRKVELGALGKTRYTKEDLEIFITAALESECLKQPLEDVLDERETWSNEIQNDNDDVLLAILLPLLPNLTALSLEPQFAGTKWYPNALEHAALATTPILRKLTQVRLNAPYGLGAHVTEIQRFSAIPSVDKITAPGAYGMDCLQELSSDRISNATHLKLWESRVDSKAIFELLRGFSKLKLFTYSCTYSDGAQHNAFLIRASLLAHCKATLQSLTLLIPSCGSTSFMGSLRDFQTLKELYTEWCFLCPVRHVESLELNKHMPSSLVRLKLHDSLGRRKSEYEKAIKSSQYAREHRLQKLKWLVFGGACVKWSLEEIDRDLRKTCLNMGITVIFSPYAPKSGD